MVLIYMRDGLHISSTPIAGLGMTEGSGDNRYDRERKG